MNSARIQARIFFEASDEFIAAAFDECEQFKVDGKFHTDFLLAQFSGFEL